MSKARSLNILTATAVLLLSCGLYLKIMTPVISPGDGPEFAVAAYNLDIAHPPGYPFWMLAGKVFTTLPLGNIGWRTNQVSLTSIVLATALLFVCVVKLTSRKSALVAALTFMTTFQIMQTAGGAEVYPQLILWIALLFSLSVNQAGGSRSYLLLCLLTGIGVGIHYLSLLFIPGWLILKIRSLEVIKRLSFKKVILALLAFILGLTLFCALPLRSVTNPFLHWEQVEFAEYFSAHVERSAYRQMEREDKTDWLSRKKFFLDFIRRLFLDTYTFGASLLFLWGLLVLFLKDKRLFLGLATLFFLPVMIIILHLRFRFNPLNQSRLNNYYLPVYLIGAVAIGFGYRFWDERLKRNGQLIIFLFFIFSLASFLSLNYQKVDQRKSYFVLDLGENTIRQLPQGTIFFSKSDPVAFPLWFVQAVNNQRRDVAHIVTNLMQPSQFAWYRYHLRAWYPKMFANPEEEKLRY